MKGYRDWETGVLYIVGTGPENNVSYIYENGQYELVNDNINNLETINGGNA